MPVGPKPADLSRTSVNGIEFIRFSHRLPGPKGKRYWLCRCHCGNEFTTVANAVKDGSTKSCGCSLANRKNRLTHGLRKTPEYQSWAGMKQRCLNPKNPRYDSYGGRGITICKRWMNSFDNFYADMGPKPSPLHTIERKNNDGNYTPRNCIWGDKKQQANNRRKAPPRPSHPNSLANLRSTTSADMRKIWDTTLAHKRRQPRNCDHCGKLVKKPGYKAHVYCSSDCYVKARWRTLP